MKKQALKDDSLFGKDTFILKSNGKLAEKYLKIKELGSGSYSKVFRVESKTNKQVYACKQIQKEKITNFQNFKNEINILSKVDQPNIIKLYEIFEDKRYIYLIMEECTGGELFDKINDLIDKDEVFSEKEAAIIFKQLMSAVSYCHNQGICHRDIKPENILFLNNEKNSPIKLVDFGVSKIFGEIKPLMKGNKLEKNIMSCRVGTAYYISPEVLQGNYDYKCDIWSCGVILYLLLSGHPPFDGETENEIYRAIQKKKYTFNEDEWKNISDEAKDLIKHMICDADKRYNAEMVLGHPWIEKNAANAKGAIDKLNLKNIKNYTNFSKLKKMALFFVATRLGEKEVKELKEAYEEFDTNKDGTLSMEEIKNGIKKVLEKEKEKKENGQKENENKEEENKENENKENEQKEEENKEKEKQENEQKEKENKEEENKDKENENKENEKQEEEFEEEDEDYGLDEINLEELFKKVDSNKSEKIDYTEFIAAAMEHKAFIREEKLIDFFNMLDKDGSGKLSKKEIKAAICHEGLENDVVDKIIAEFDLNGDGEIDFMEFVTGLSTVSKKEEEVPENSKTQTLKKTHK